METAGRERERERERAGRGRFAPPPRGSFGGQATGNHYGPAGGGSGGVGRYGAMAAAAGFRGRERYEKFCLCFLKVVLLLGLPFPCFTHTLFGRLLACRLSSRFAVPLLCRELA